MSCDNIFEGDCYVLCSQFRDILELSNSQQTVPIWGKDYHVEILTRCLPVIERIIPCSDLPILLVSSPKVTSDKNFKYDTFSDKSNFSEKYVDSELELTGCPLEYSFDVKVSSSELDLSVFSLNLLNKMSRNEIHISSSTHKSPPYRTSPVPLSVEKARYILSVYLTNSWEKSTLSCPVWVMCDGLDPVSTVLIGVHKKDKTVDRLTVTSRGPLRIEDLPPLTVFKRQHLGFSEFEVHTSIYSRYNIFENIQVCCDASLGTEFYGTNKLILECTWNKVTKTLQKPAPDCTCFLYFHINNENQCYFKWEKCTELKLIQSISEHLLDTNKQLIWSEANTDEKVMERVKELMCSYMCSAVNIKPSVNVINNNALEDVFGNREDIDFFDELWNVLKECPSIETLQEAFSYIFHLVESREVLPFLSRKKLAIHKLLQDLYENKVRRPSLDDLLPIQLLLELGVQKLQRDYIHFFISSSFATYDQLQPFLSDKVSPIEAVKPLGILHNAVEVIVLCKTLVHLQLQSLISLTRHVLEYCSTVPDVDPSHVFKIPVLFSEAKKSIEILQPSEWQVSFNTTFENAMLKVDGKYSTVCHLSKKSPLLFVNGSNPIETHISEPLYFCTVVTSIEDNVGTVVYGETDQ